MATWEQIIMVFSLIHVRTVLILVLVLRIIIILVMVSLKCMSNLPQQLVFYIFIPQ